MRRGSVFVSSKLGLRDRTAACLVALCLVALPVPVTPARAHTAPQSEEPGSGSFGTNGGTLLDPRLQADMTYKNSAYNVLYLFDHQVSGNCSWVGTLNHYTRQLDADGTPITNWYSNSSGFSEAWCGNFQREAYHWDMPDTLQQGAARVEIKAVEQDATPLIYTARSPLNEPVQVGMTIGQCGMSGTDADVATHCQGDPVHSLTGAFVTSVRDATLPGTRIPFELSRHYNSSNTASGALGQGWIHSQEPSLTVQSSGDVLLRAERGQQVLFKRTSTCGYSAPGASSRLSVIPGTPSTSYRDEVLADQPNAYWRLGEPSGITAGNEVASGPTGTYAGGVALNQTGLLSGDADKAAGFDGIDDQVNLGSPAALKLAPPWSIEAIVSPSQAIAAEGYVAYTEGFQGDGNIRMMLGISSAARTMAVGFYNGAWRQASDPLAVPVGVPTHYVGTYDGSALKLYRNGSLVATTNYTSTGPSGNESFYIGKRWDNVSPHHFPGAIDEVAVYPSALSATRVKAHADSACPVAGYTLKREDQTTLTFDASGKLTAVNDRNGNDLTYAYDGSGRLSTITDTVGRTISFTNNGVGRLTNVALPDGRSVTYGYTNGLLTSVTDVRGNTTTYAYNAEGRLTKITDQNTHDVVTNVYGANGRITQQTDARGKLSTFSWDESSQTSTMTDPRGKEWKDTYFNNLLVRRTDRLGNVTRYQYDQAFNLIRVIDSMGNKTKMTYDSRGNLLTRTAPTPLSYVETYTYNARNDVTSYTDPKSRTTTYDYDSAGNLTKITKPGTTIWEIGRDTAGEGLVTSVTDPRGKQTTITYNGSGLPSAVTSPLGGKSTFEYDAAGRVTRVVEPRGNEQGATPTDFDTIYTYDAANHVTSVTSPLGHVSSWVYDAAGNLDTFTDAKSRTTDYGYNAANHLTSVTAPGAIVTSYTYDDAGNLASRTDPQLHTTSYTYDAAGRLTGVTAPLSRMWSYTYDANGNVTQVIDANGNDTTTSGDGTTAYAYDVLNRLTAINYSDATPDVGVTYDATSQVTEMTDGAGTETYAYDSLDRLTSITRGTDALSYGYDAASNVTSRTYPGASALSYGYDDDGRLKTVTQDTDTTTYGYDVAGRLTSTMLPSGNGFTESRTYDRDGRVTEVKNTSSSTTLSDFDYVYDPVGNPTSVTSLAGTTAYSYDSLDRLTEACFTTTCTDYIRYTYDDVGNRLTEERPSGTTSYAYNGADELTSTTLGATTTDYSHDKNGNMTGAGSDFYTYDLANRTKTIAQGASTTTYSYDGLGKRLQASTGANNADKTNFLWDPTWSLPEMVLERDGSGSQLRRYLYGHGPLSMTAGGGKSYYHRDALGSITNVTSSSGAEQWSYAYEPFGTTTPTQVDANAASNPLAFTGQYSDPTGLYHLRARQYEAELGRFFTVDPLDSGVGMPYVAAYAYVANNPTAAIDPSGLIAQTDISEVNYYTQPLPSQLQVLGIEGKTYSGPSLDQDCRVVETPRGKEYQCGLAPLPSHAATEAWLDCVEASAMAPWIGAAIGAGYGTLIEPGGGTAVGMAGGFGVGEIVAGVSPASCVLFAAWMS